MANKVYLIIFIIIALVINQVTLRENVQHKIPKYLEECYSKPALRNRALRMPATIGTLIYLIQKAERNGHTESYTKNAGGVLDARVMSYSILHRFRLDGIERIPDIPNYEGDNDDNTNMTTGWNGVVPYAPLGFQYSRYKILLGELIPGNAILFPNSTLSPHEKCALHFMLSSTVDIWERGDEGTTCRRPRVDKPIGLSRYSPCPLEDGVMAVHTPYSLRADTVSPGTVIAGIAAALQYQAVPLSNLVHSKEVSGEGSEMPDLGPEVHDIPKTPIVQNTWAATLAGDLAEVAIYQGPYKLQTSGKAREAIHADIVVGADGWWGGGPNVSSEANPYSIESRVAKWYYLIRSKDLEITDAEIRGGIDGLLLGSGILRWNDIAKGRIRLSQILEMYYSEKGMAAYGEPDLKYCNRLERFLHGSGAGGANPNENNLQILLSQTMTFAQILYEEVHPVVISKDLLQEFVQLSVQQLQKYLTTDIDDQHCFDDYYEEDEVFKGYPQVDLIILTDGSWKGLNFTKVMAYLAEECDVSLFGSRMSIMHGRTAEWIVRDAVSASDVIYNITKEAKSLQQTSVSVGLDFSLTLGKLGQYLSEKKILEKARIVAKGIRSQVVMFFSHGSSLLITDQSSAQKDMKTLLTKNPDAHFFFVALDKIGDPFSGLGIQTIRAQNDMPETVIPAVLEQLRLVPRRIVASNCDGKKIPGRDINANDGGRGKGQLELEDYVSYGQLTTYRLHPAYFKDSREPTIEFVGSGYGEVMICMTRYRPDEPRKTSKPMCQQMISDSVKFTFHEPCPGAVPYAGECFPIYFTVNVTKTYKRCTEDDCRFPDQVRISIWQEDLKCNDASSLSQMSLFFHLLTLFILYAVLK